MKGRNLDYGKVTSDSREGEMAKRALLTMAKDLYNLYISLRNEDDLPSWCHYKIARSQVELQSVTDYLTSKITKMCLDNDIQEDQLKIQIQDSLQNDHLAEGIFSFLKSKNNKKSDREARDNLRKTHNPNVNVGNNYSNETIRFINLSTQIASVVRSISGDSSYELDRQNKRVPLDSLNLIKIVRDECVKIYDIFNLEKKEFVPKTTSARKKKLPWYKRLLFKEDYSIEIKNKFLRNLEILLDGVSQYFAKNVNTEKDVGLIKQMTVYSDQDFNTLKEDLVFVIRTLNNFIQKEESNDTQFRSH